MTAGTDIVVFGTLYLGLLVRGETLHFGIIKTVCIMPKCNSGLVLSLSEVIVFLYIWAHLFKALLV